MPSIAGQKQHGQRQCISVMEGNSRFLLLNDQATNGPAVAKGTDKQPSKLCEKSKNPVRWSASVRLWPHGSVGSSGQCLKWTVQERPPRQSGRLGVSRGSAEKRSR